MSPFGRLLAAAAGALPVLFLAVPHGVVVAGLVVSLAALPARCPPAPAWGLAAAAVAWAAVGAGWAPDHAAALVTTAKVAVTALLGWAAFVRARRLRPDEAAAVARLMAASVVLCLAALAVETASAKGLSEAVVTLFRAHPQEPGQKSPLNHGLALLALLLWPLAVAVVRLHGRGAAAGLVVAALLTGLAVDSQSGRAALAVGASFMALAAWRPAAAFRLLRLGTVAVLLAAPLAAAAIPEPQATFQWRLPNSAHHRLTIWNFAADAIAEHPVRGWGMDASRAIPGGDDEVEVMRRGLEHNEWMREQWLPLHPHCGALQLWLELGLPGVLLAAAMLWLGLGRLGAAGRDPVMRAAWGASAAAAFAVANLSYGLWQSWWQADLWLVAIFAAALGLAQPASSRKARSP